MANKTYKFKVAFRLGRAQGSPTGLAFGTYQVAKVKVQSPTGTVTVQRAKNVEITSIARVTTNEEAEDLGYSWPGNSSRADAAWKSTDLEKVVESVIFSTFKDGDRLTYRGQVWLFKGIDEESGLPIWDANPRNYVMRGEKCVPRTKAPQAAKAKAAKLRVAKAAKEMGGTVTECGTGVHRINRAAQPKAQPKVQEDFVAAKELCETLGFEPTLANITALVQAMG